MTSSGRSVAAGTADGRDAGGAVDRGVPADALPPGTSGRDKASTVDRGAVETAAPSGARAVPPGLRLLGSFFGFAVRDSWRSGAAQFEAVRRGRRLATWAQRVDRDREFGLIADYHRVVSEDLDPTDHVDDRTWDDLDGDALFAEVDRCESAPGQQVLYAMLRRSDASDADLNRLDSAACLLARNARLRDSIRRRLAPLATRDAYFLHNLFSQALPPRPRFYWVFPLLTAAALAMVGVAFVRPGLALAGLLTIGTANFIIQYRYHSRIYMFVAPLTLLNRLITAAKKVAGSGPGGHGSALVSEPTPATRSATESPASPARASRTPNDETALDHAFDTMRAAATRLGPLASVARYVAFERSDSITGSIYMWLNAVLLLDINAFVFTVSRLRIHRDDVRLLFESIGFVDAAQSVASWRADLGTWCRPETLPRGRTLECRQLIHPLLDEPVANDFRVDGESVLITGSNMSGKTTFIRAVAVNALLARTVATCAAAAFRAPPLVVRSMIGRGDSLLDGQSYFAVELMLAQQLVSAAASDRQHLFVIDEIFRGTNTTERIAASKAVLRRLAASDHLVLAATHDLELLTLLDAGWAFHHFRESVDEDRLTFDYTIRPGPTSTHNAIRMMSVYGFPDDVVEDARDTVSRLERDRTGRASLEAPPD